MQHVLREESQPLPLPQLVDSFKRVVTSVIPLGPLREIDWEIIRALYALQGGASSILEWQIKQSASSCSFIIEELDFSLSPMRNKVDIVPGKSACNLTTNSSVNRPMLALELNCKQAKKKINPIKNLA